MNRSKDFTTAIEVKQSANEVFQSICNVDGWWSGEVIGNADKLHEEFTYTVQGIHFSRQKVTEFVPGKKIVWLVTDASLSFVDNPKEWIGTEICFDIASNQGITRLNFTHKGLKPALECFGNCSNAWSLLISINLKRFIETGVGQPAPW